MIPIGKNVQLFEWGQLISNALSNPLESWKEFNKLETHLTCFPDFCGRHRKIITNSCQFYWQPMAVPTRYERGWIPNKPLVSDYKIFENLQFSKQSKISTYFIQCMTKMNGTVGIGRAVVQNEIRIGNWNILSYWIYKIKTTIVKPCRNCSFFPLMSILKGKTGVFSVAL